MLRRLVFNNKIIFVRTFCKKHQNHDILKNAAASLVLEKLTQRSLLKIKGQGSDDLLQGLITNDINHLKEHNQNSMYTMFLNSKGRVLLDSIIYKYKNDSYILELDKSMIPLLESHLKMYLLRKKIELSNLQGIFNAWVLFDSKSTDSVSLNPILNKILSQTNNNISQDYTNNELFIYKDPRSYHLGLRLLVPAQIDSASIRSQLQLANLNSILTYKALRYQLGVGEGSVEIPPEKSFPMEVNGDYLHGISFQKGCYLGQELTARTYHLGVIRKRLMPLIFKNDNVREVLADNESILSNTDKSVVGKLRGVDKQYGLGLLRIENALKCSELIVGNLRAVTRRPNWWPIEVNKELIKENV